jgi:hypothetical protein
MKLKNPPSPVDPQRQHRDRFLANRFGAMYRSAEPVRAAA